jgi:hypothetical protein
MDILTNGACSIQSITSFDRTKKDKNEGKKELQN